MLATEYRPYPRALDLEVTAAAITPFWLGFGWWQIRLPCGLLLDSPKTFEDMKFSLGSLEPGCRYILVRLGTAAVGWRVRARLSLTISAGGRRTVRRIQRKGG